MTPAQRSIYQDLLQDAYILEVRHHHKGKQFKLFRGNMVPIRWIKDSEYKLFTFVMRKDKKGRLVLDRRAIRKLHGRNLLKKIYREQLQKMDSNRRCANLPMERLAPHSHRGVLE